MVSCRPRPVGGAASNVHVRGPLGPAAAQAQLEPVPAHGPQLPGGGWLSGDGDAHAPAPAGRSWPESHPAALLPAAVVRLAGLAGLSLGRQSAEVLPADAQSAAASAVPTSAAAAPESLRVLHFDPAPGGSTKGSGAVAHGDTLVPVELLEWLSAASAADLSNSGGWVWWTWRVGICPRFWSAEIPARLRIRRSAAAVQLRERCLRSR